MAQAFLESSQDFVRALKARTDPPEPIYPTKIEIAEQAWSDSAFYVPNKAEVIVDWILTRLLKEKDQETSANPLFDNRYWQLLLSILEETSRGSDRRTSSWLTRLLHRIPLNPVIVKFLLESPSAPNIEDLVVPFASCVTILWPDSSQRMNAEVQQDCFGVLLHCLRYDGLEKIAIIIAKSYRNSFSNSSNKKKLLQTFLQHLSAWLQVLVSTKERDCSAILDAGMDTIFNLEALRQTQSTEAGHPIIPHLQTLAQESDILVFDSIPMLFAHYVRGLSKHRGALFSQSSHGSSGASLEKYRESAMSFFSSLLALVGESDDQSAWKSRLALLHVVKEENIFHSLQPSSSMSQLLEHCSMSLADHQTGDQRADLVVQCLSMVTQIDYDLIASMLQKLISQILQTPALGQTDFKFLDLLLDYHIKRRTLDDFVFSILSSILAPYSGASSSLDHAQARYPLVSSSSLMHPTFLNNLAKAIRNFMTEGQCLHTIERICETSKASWERIHDIGHSSHSKRSKKKQRSTSDIGMDVDKPSELSSSEMDSEVVTYSVIARLGSVVCSSLATQSMSPDGLERVGTYLVNLRRDLTHRSISRMLKRLKKEDVSSSGTWAVQIALAASLRWLYALDISRSLVLPPADDEKTVRRLFELLDQGDALLPELVVEMFRKLLNRISSQALEDHEQVFEQLLGYIERYYSLSDHGWSSKNYLSTSDANGRANASLALLSIIIERRLPELDKFASKSVLKRLLKLLVRTDLVSIHDNGEEQGSTSFLMLRVLRSAHFWEFRNIRTAFLELLDESTSPLISDSTSVSQQIAVTTLLEATSVVHLLLFFPQEYLTWSLLQELTRRMVAADRMFVKNMQLTPADRRQILQRLVLLRAFVKRIYAYANTAGSELGKEQVDDVVVHLLQPPLGTEEDMGTLSIAFENATLDLVDVFLVRLLRASKRNGAENINSVLRLFDESVFRTPCNPLLSNCFGRIVRSLTLEVGSTSVHEGVIRTLGERHSELSSVVLPAAEHLTSEDFDMSNLRQSLDILSHVDNLLRLAKWLNLSERQSHTRMIATRVLLKAIPVIAADSSHNPGIGRLVILIFSILLQELDYLPRPDRGQHLDLIVATYILLVGQLPSSFSKELDDSIVASIMKMAVGDYDHLLSFVADSLRQRSSETPTNHLIHLAALLLRSHPSHSLVFVQKFATSCLGTFLDTPQFTVGDTGLRLQILHMVSQYCSDQQAALRAQETSLVLLLVSKYAAPCPADKHDEATCRDIFYSLISILSTLIRLRRDLVMLYLPHLGSILNRLIYCMKRCRPNLGAKQTSLMLDNLPQWICPSQPLGVEEARALARLLEAFTLKTVIRTISSLASLEHQKAEALSKPFSKHAAYVLQAYIEVMNDPLCILPLDVRRELKPGLFALCSMIGEHSRDALMVSGGFGDGGKAVLKSVWKEWEAMKYVGKG